MYMEEGQDGFKNVYKIGISKVKRGLSGLCVDLWVVMFVKGGLSGDLLC